MSWLLAYVLAIVVGLGFLALHVHSNPVCWPNVTHDGELYWRLSEYGCAPIPYGIRWLIPKLLGTNHELWRISTWAALVLTCPALVWLMRVRGFVPWQAVVGVVMFVSLPGVWKFNVSCPVLVDAPAQLMSVVAAAGAIVHPALGVGMAVLGGTIKETVPIIAALAAGSSWPLLGLLVVPWGWLKFCRSGEVDRWEAVKNELVLTRNSRAETGELLRWEQVIAPWGFVLPLALLAPSWLTVAALAFGYGLLFVARDMERVYQMSWPVVVMAAVTALGADWQPWMLVLLVLQLWHPWNRGLLGRKKILFRGEA